ncbi:MAG: nucleotidyltransferase domain-containing protein [Prolixibacteraceae bacterium]|jgi:predicted nucleotidyltransferase
MRVNSNDIKAIKEVTKAVFGETATIRLFGSRTDDKKKGGDIDLLIQYNQTISRMELYQLKIKFLVQLKKIVDDQKIDVIIDNGQQRNNIFYEAYKEGMLL